MDPLYIPWDFILILIFLGIVVPWRGAARMKRLLNKPELNSADRLSLYASTIIFQLLIVSIVALRTLARSVSPEELGLAVPDPRQVIWVSFTLAVVLCVNQVIGLRRITKMPDGKRGSFFAITERIMPRTRTETLVFSALALTAGLSEEFLYRGFVFMAFVRMVVNFGPPNTIAAILSSALFSLAHIYQGRRGLITTFIVGIIFVVIRTWTGSLVPAVVAHAGLDFVAGLTMSKFLRKV